MNHFSILRLSIGLFLLTGCTFNQQITNSQEVHAPIVLSSTVVVDVELEVEAVDKEPLVPAVQPRKQCAAYKPLQIKPPVQIDLDLIRKAKDGDEINLILRTNVGALNEQIKSFSIEQEKHYRAWLKRCVSKS